MGLLSPSTYWPRMTVIIVGKRHHTRSHTTSNQADLKNMRNGSPKIGTVVDRGVTEAWRLDFFCQAHTGLQDTESCLSVA